MKSIPKCADLFDELAALHAREVGQAYERSCEILLGYAHNGVDAVVLFTSEGYQELW